ncbi:hypothetical protein MKX08_000778 [Trichoderma sp. CBMAI-0020]|nr:hypothetical protein MKX08_000778 [Trichoderma sp. CBMAI-0020]
MARWLWNPLPIFPSFDSSAKYFPTSHIKKADRLQAPPLMVVATEAAERHGVKICVDRLHGCSPKLLGAFPSEHVLHIYRLYDVFCTADETGGA